MKIPTLLGLTLLLIAISLGIFLFTYKQKIDSKKKSEFTPSDIQVVNINDTAATIIWQTKTTVNGSINWGKTTSLEFIQNDDRDTTQEPNPYLIHFVTIKNLEPQSSYFFKIQDGIFKFPEQAMEFKTGKTLTKQAASNSPLIGTVLDEDLQPVADGLVFLKLDQASSIATYVTSNGNYILPLTDLRDKTLSKQFLISNDTPAFLTITKGDLKSNVKIILNNSKRPLPPAILGQDLDLSANISDDVINYDLNEDGQINSIDLAIVLSNLEKDSPDLSADLNQDDLVDQEDVDLMKQALGQNP